MNKRIIKYSLSLLIIYSHTTLAKNAVEMCEEKMKTLNDISHCLDNAKEKKDRELKTWIESQTFILKDLATNTGRKSALNMFKRAHENFISYREDNCRWQYLTISSSVVEAAIAYKKCFIYLTEDRIEEFITLNKKNE